MSLLQPDAIATFTVGGETYFVTANEGDARVGTGSTAEEVRLSSAGYDLDNTVFPDEATLKQDANLGRLNVINHEGDTDGDGDIDVITTFGGRGISIFKQNADGSIEKVRETGGEFERIIAQQPNANLFFNGENAFGTFDSRSDNKGPEPEGVDIGVINGHTYAFVTLERAGGVMIYDVTDPANATFVGYKPPLPPTAQPSADNAPETVKFISAADSPTGTALVVTANEVGNATTVYAAVTPIYRNPGLRPPSALRRPERHDDRRRHRGRQQRLLHPGPERRRQCRHLRRHLRVHQRAPRPSRRPERAGSPARSTNSRRAAPRRELLPITEIVAQNASVVDPRRSATRRSPRSDRRRRRARAADRATSSPAPPSSRRSKACW